MPCFNYMLECLDPVDFSKCQVGVGEKGKISVTDTNDECSVEKLSEFKRRVAFYGQT